MAYNGGVGQGILCVEGFGTAVVAVGNRMARNCKL